MTRLGRLHARPRSPTSATRATAGRDEVHAAPHAALRLRRDHVVLARRRCRSATLLGFAALAARLPRRSRSSIVARYADIYERGVPIDDRRSSCCSAGIQLITRRDHRRVRRADLRRGQAPAAVRRARARRTSERPSRTGRGAERRRAVRIAVLGAGRLPASSPRTGSRAPGTRSTSTSAGPGSAARRRRSTSATAHRLERYYHHLFTTDRHIAALYDELGMPDELEWRPLERGVLRRTGAQWPFTTPLDLLRFRPLSPARARAHGRWPCLRLQRGGDDAGRSSGSPRAPGSSARWAARPGDEVWGPLLRGKFGERADEIAMVWLWSKLPLRRQLEGERGARGAARLPARAPGSRCSTRCARAIEARGGRVLIDRPAARLVRATGDGVAVPPARRAPSAAATTRAASSPRGEPERYDAVLATVPNDVFEQLLDPGLAARGRRRLPRRGCARSSTSRRSACCSSSTAAFTPLLLDQRRRPARCRSSG